MNDAEVSATDLLQPEELSLNVRVGKRVYPQWEKSLPEIPNESTVKLQSEEAPQPLADRLYATLWPQLRVSQWNLNDPPSRDEMVQGYNDSLDRLEKWYSDWRQLIETICRTRLSWRHEAGEVIAQLQTDILKSRLERMITSITSGWKLPMTIVTAEITIRDLNVVFAQLKSSAETQLLGFCRTIETSLESLVDQQQIGLVEWVGGGGCRYHFFREAIVQKGSKRDVEFVRGGMGRVDEDITSLDVAYCRQRHVHQLMNASPVQLMNHAWAIPAHERQIIEALPEWLKDFTRIAEGTLMCSTAVEREFYRQTWTVREPRPRRYYHDDPALILDQFVLTGWGPDDIAGEEQQQSARKQETERVTQKSVVPLWLGASVLATSCFILLVGLRPGSHLAAGLSLALGIAFTMQAISAHRDSRHGDVGWMHFVSGLLLTLGVSFSGGLLLTCLQRVDHRPIAMTLFSGFVTFLLGVMTLTVFQRNTSR